MPQQLTLQFGLGEPEMEMLSEEASGFLANAGAKIFEVKTAKILHDTPEVFEIVMPNRITAYHRNTLNGGLANFFDGALENYFMKGGFLDKKHVPSIKHLSLAHSPAYFRMSRDLETDKITCDYGLYVYSRETENVGRINQDEVYFRLWVHSVYTISPYEHRHRLDETQSYFGVSSDKYSVGTHVASYEKMDEYFFNILLAFPWQHLLTLDNSKSQWWKRMTEAIETKLQGFLLFEPEKQKSYTTFVNSKDPGQKVKRTLTTSPLLNRQGYMNTRSSMHTMAALSVASSDTRELIEKFVAYGIGESIKLSPHLFKYLQEYYEAFFNGADTEEFLIADALNNFLAPVKFLHALIEHYDDVSILDMFPVQYWKRTESSTYNTNGYIGTVFTSIEIMLNDSLFKVFPRAKQYRLLAEPFEQRYQLKVVEMKQAEMPAATPRNAGAGYANGANNVQYVPARPANLNNRGGYGADTPLRELYDLINMLRQIQAKDVSTAENIDARRVKTIRQYHDEAVKVFNKFRYKAIPIKASYLQWITDYGLEIPDTSLKLVLPEDTNTVREWGQIQGHCIGSYCENMAKGTTVLLGVWDNEKNDWFGHMQFQPLTGLDGKPRQGRPASVQVGQFYGKRNCQLPAETKSVVTSHLNKAIATYHTKLDEDLEKEKDIDV